MSTLAVEADSVIARSISVTDEYLIAHLADARTLSVPVSWYPRLQNGTEEERSNWQLIGKGEGIHWPDLDEDISIAGLVAGRPSGESHSSLQRWFDRRK